MYKLKESESAVFFVDILGLKALTSLDKPLDLLKINTDVFMKYLQDLNLEDNTFDLEDNYSRNMIIASWLLKTFRECIDEVSKRYNIKNDIFSDCAYLWSPSIKDILFAVTDLMWNLTFKGVYCRGGLSYGKIIENDGNNKNKIVLGEAVSRAYLKESKSMGKGCRIFTDRDFVKTASEQAKSESDGLFLLSIYNELFEGKTLITDYSILDEFLWFSYPNIFLLASKESTNKNNKIKSVLYRSELIARIMTAETYIWNKENNEGKVHISAGIQTISGSISKVINNYEKTNRYDSDYVDNWFLDTNINYRIQFKQLHLLLSGILEFLELKDNIKKKLYKNTLKHFAKCLENNRFYNKVW